MADASVAIKEDAAPTKQLASQTHLHGGTTVHAEEIVIVDSAGNLVNVVSNRLAVDGSGVNQPVTDAGGSLTVDAIDLDIRNLVPAQDEVKVSGQAADGAAVAGNPVRIAGKDGGGLTQDILTDASGNLQINVLDSADTVIDPVIKTQLPSALISSRLDVNLGAAPATVTVQGAAAQGASVSGNPLLSGGEARTTNPTAVTDGQAVRQIHDKLGRQSVVLSHIRDLVTDGGAITISTTTETTILAAVASTFLDLTLLLITNTSATATRVDIRDDTAGTVRFSVAIAANGGAVIPFNVPMKQGTVNKNWTAQLSTAVTDIRIVAQAVKNT
jgi:hypothetical protein